MNHSPDNTILQVEGLKKYFPIRRGFFQRVTGWVNAVEDVSFRIEKGKTLGLVGESGCGKTTVARLVLKLLQADEGKIIYNGQDITDLSEKEMKPFRKQIQIIFQDPYGSLNPRMTIGQTLSEGLQVNGIRNNGEKDAQLENLLKMVGMSPRSIDRYPHEFSGGQRQRIGIARALSVQPSLVICDEPVSALDVSIQAQIINLLKDLQDQLALSYLFISHDLNVVGYLCNDVAVMYRGQIMEHGPADALFDNPSHPYTHMLLSAAPDSEADAKPTITPPENEIPQTATLPSGCTFRQKCHLEEPQCRNTDQRFAKVGDNHYVRCWKVAQNGAAEYF
ncbi:MAG: ABC transporter ATP-binding protein [Desulfobacterales bacterium]|nr:MAG: ABC transporter ATP-binding protein [Desulfobacterales bacterium]